MAALLGLGGGAMASDSLEGNPASGIDSGAVVGAMEGGALSDGGLLPAVFARHPGGAEQCEYYDEPCGPPEPVVAARDPSPYDEGGELMAIGNEAFAEADIGAPAGGELQPVAFERGIVEDAGEGPMKVAGLINEVDLANRTITLDNGETYVLTTTEPGPEKLVPFEMIAFKYNTEGNQNLIVGEPVIGPEAAYGVE